MSEQDKPREIILSWHDLNPDHTVILDPDKCWLSKAKGVNHKRYVEIKALEQAQARIKELEEENEKLKAELKESEENFDFWVSK